MIFILIDIAISEEDIEKVFFLIDVLELDLAFHHFIDIFFYVLLGCALN